MRNPFVTLLTGTILLGFITISRAQQPIKAPDPDKVLAEALKNIKNKDKIDLRIQAAMDLADFGVKAEPALNDLLDALQTKNEDLRLNAAIALGKIGKRAVGPVAELLKSGDVDTKFYAIWTIGWIGADAKETVPTMFQLLKDDNEGVRRKAAFALGQLGTDADKTIDMLVVALKDKSPEVRQTAGEALAKFGKKAVPPLVDLLKSDDIEAQMQASISLGHIGADAKDAEPVLRDRFLSTTHPRPNPHHYSQILAKLGKAGVPALELGLKDARADVRNSAATALQQIGADAVGVLVDALGDKNVEVRRLAAQTLIPMRIGDKSVVIALAFGLSDSDDLFRQNCMQGLAMLGPQAKLGGAKIKEALVDMNQQVRQQAYYLLQQIGDDPRPTLKKGLTSKDDKVRINTASLMVGVGFDVNDATPVLVDALKNNDLGLRMQAAFTMAQRNLHSDKTQPIFVAGVKHPSAGVRIQACQGLSMLGNHGVTGESGIKALTTALKDPETQVRQQALNALQSQRGDLAMIVPTLVELMKDKNVNARQQVIWLFTRTGEAGALPLAELLKDPHAEIRWTAMQTLRNLGAKANKALPAIKEAVKDENTNVRLNAMLFLATVGGEGPQFLVKHFSSEQDANVRSQLLQNLAYSGQSKFAMPLLKTAMKDPSDTVRQATVNILGYFRDAPEAFDVFTTGLKDTNPNIRMQSAYNAGNYGNKSWAPLVEAMKSHKESNMRQAVLQGMMNSNFRAKTGVDPIAECLKDGNPTVRQWACIVLGNIGPEASGALPSLREVAKSDSNLAVQSQARATIGQIEAKKK